MLRLIDVSFLVAGVLLFAHACTEPPKKRDINACRDLFNMGPTGRAQAYSAGCVLEVKK